MKAHSRGTDAQHMNGGLHTGLQPCALNYAARSSGCQLLMSLSFQSTNSYANRLCIHRRALGIFQKMTTAHSAELKTPLYSKEMQLSGHSVHLGEGSFLQRCMPSPYFGIFFY